MANIGATVFFEYSDNIYLDKPMLIHLRGHDNGVTRDNMTVYSYPDVQSSDFVVPGQPGFKMSTAGVAHSRSLRFFKKHLDGPYFDLEKIWDEHTFYEFGDRSVEKTMATMVQEPYVNHIPTVCIADVPLKMLILVADRRNRPSSVE